VCVWVCAREKDERECVCESRCVTMYIFGMFVNIQTKYANHTQKCVLKSTLFVQGGEDP